MPWLKIFLDSMKQIDLLWHQSAFHSFLIQPWIQLVWVLQMPYQNIQISSQSNCYKCCSNLHFLPTCPESWKNWKHTQTSLPCLEFARVQTYLRNIFLVLSCISASSSFYCVTAGARNRPSAGASSEQYLYLFVLTQAQSAMCIMWPRCHRVVSADSIILHHRLINTDPSRQ